MFKSMFKAQDPPSPGRVVWVKTVEGRRRLSDDLNSDLALQARGVSILNHCRPPDPQLPPPVHCLTVRPWQQDILSRRFAVLFTDLCCSVITLPPHTSQAGMV